ncbi:MAG: patatin-like phospholipase family protein, partial [Chloroflexota bacterium]|nr:patatin-like phospholipase family protein [Chloroflexota bacterium]
LDTGPVLPAVQASFALPFIARPVDIGGRLYADGGLFDTLPARVARGMGADVVIGVCLGHNYHAPKALRRRPWTRPVLERLGRQSALMRLTLLDQARFFARLCAATFDPPAPSEDADITIWPEFGDIGPNSMAGSAFCYDQGLAAAQEALPHIERLLQERSGEGAQAG